MSERLEAWSIRQLQEKLLEDLANCHTELEKSMVKAIGGKEIRAKAEQWAKVRKLTPIEVAIAQQYGYKGV